MKKSYTSTQVQQPRHPKRVSTILATALFLGLVPGAWVSGVQAQCFVAETGDITGNVPYGSSINWANPNRVEISDDLHARTSLSPGDTTKYLSVSDFGYVLPTTATILGIEVAVEKHQDNELTDATDASVRLMKAGTAAGNDYAINATWQDKDFVDVYGGPSDLWGETWTPADINSLDFGVLFSATRLSGAPNEYVFVDYVIVTVYFTDVSCTLPITMKSFRVSSTGNRSAQLDWTTASEASNSHFEVERSTDGKTFSTIGTVAGSGTTSSEHSYTFEDTDPASGTNLYRLRQVDFNGASTLSTVVSLEISTLFGLNAYPNPATDRITITLDHDRETFTATLLDLQGRVVKRTVATGTATEFDLTTVTPGIYMLSVESGLDKSTTKILKQ